MCQYFLLSQFIIWSRTFLSFLPRYWHFAFWVGYQMLWHACVYFLSGRCTSWESVKTLQISVVYRSHMRKLVLFCCVLLCFQNYFITFTVVFSKLFLHLYPELLPQTGHQSSQEEKKHILAGMREVLGSSPGRVMCFPSLSHLVASVEVDLDVIKWFQNTTKQ